MSERVAGRELDAEVSLKVMGHVWDATRCRVCGWRLAGHVMDGCVPDNCSMRPVPKSRADEPRPYSTDIAAAWQVVEKIRSQPDLYDHWQLDSLGFVGEEWRCTFSADLARDNRVFHHADAATAPLAICLAALQAVSPAEEKEAQ